MKMRTQSDPSKNRALEDITNKPSEYENRTEQHTTGCKNLQLKNLPIYESTRASTARNETSHSHQSHPDSPISSSMNQEIEQLTQQINCLQKELQQLRRESSIAFSENVRMKSQIERFEFFCTGVAQAVGTSSYDLNEILALVIERCSKSLKLENLRYKPTPSSHSTAKLSLHTPISNVENPNNTHLASQVSEFDCKESPFPSNSSYGLNNSGVKEVSFPQLKAHDEDDMVRIKDTSRSIQVGSVCESSQVTEEGPKRERGKIKEVFVRTIRLVLCLLKEEYGFGLRNLVILGAESEDKEKLKEAQDRIETLENISKVYYRGLPHFKNMNKGQYISALEDMFQFFEKFSSECLEEKSKIKEVNIQILKKLGNVVCDQQELMLHVMKIPKVF